MDPLLLGLIGLVALFALRFYGSRVDVDRGVPTATATPAAVAGDEPPGVEPWQAKMIADVLHEHKRKQAKAELVSLASDALKAANK